MAKDANGEDIPTHYEIHNNKLVQIIDFDENSAFPIIADPTYKYVYTTSGSLSLLGYTTTGAAAAIVFSAGGPASAALVTVVAAAITDGCKAIKWTCAVYSYTSKGVFHVKRVFGCGEDRHITTDFRKDLDFFDRSLIPAINKRCYIKGLKRYLTRSLNRRISAGGIKECLTMPHMYRSMFCGHQVHSSFYG